MLKVNEYFDGKVKSIALENNEGKATAGVMAPGEYEFGTSTKEYMHIVSGILDVKLPGEADFKKYSKGEMFEVESGVKFNVSCSEDVAYLCFYE